MSLEITWDQSNLMDAILHQLLAVKYIRVFTNKMFGCSLNTVYFITVAVSNTLFKTDFIITITSKKAASPLQPSPPIPPINATSKDKFQVILLSFNKENRPFT